MTVLSLLFVQVDDGDDVKDDDDVLMFVFMIKMTTEVN